MYANKQKYNISIKIVRLVTQILANHMRGKKTETERIANNIRLYIIHSKEDTKK